jgi:hypothetical protein
MSDPQHPPGDAAPQPIAPPNGTRRKRVVAREVELAGQENGAAVESVETDAIVPAPRRLPGFESDAVLSIPANPEPMEAHAERHDPTPVVDPTLLGRRQRRSGHHRIYRWTQLLTMTSALASAASVICTMVDEPLAGRIIAAAALLVGLIAVALSARTSLSMRWRGWAIAAAVFAASALALTWIHAIVTDHDAAPPPIKKTVSLAAPSPIVTTAAHRHA